MKIRKNDKVMVMRGKDKGKTGLVLKTFASKNEVLVEGMNQAKKHKKGDSNGRGELITITRPINVSKVMLVDPETDKPTKVGYVVEANGKFRVSKKTGNKIVNVKTVEASNNEEEKPKNAKKTKTKSTTKSKKS